jgi:single-stranded-DNA-specific exonuclease
VFVSQQVLRDKHSKNFKKGAKFLWQLNKPKQDVVKKISKENNVSLPVAEVLFSRGFRTKLAVQEFLQTFKEQCVYSPEFLKDSKKAVKRILQAIEKKEKILIFGDYDVDGITSTTVALKALMPLGANINYFLPNREKDGYGLSAKIIEKAHRSGYKLIITVDNGITAFKPIEKANQRDIDVVVTDHHKEHGDLPPAHAIVNPNQKQCSYPFKNLAGVGVIFKLMQMLYEKLDKQFPEDIYELLMLGTVADVVPLIGENRYWVRKGLSSINKQKSYALEVLAKNNKLTKQTFDSLDIGFMIAPQINALGRLDDSRDAVKFLMSSDEEVVEKIGAVLRKKNEERKLVEQKIYDQIEGVIFDKNIDLKHENIIMAAHTSWPSGIIGLVAGKLMHNFGKPAFLFHHDTKKNLFKGSCRSIKEFNVFEALVECKDLLISFGGHAHAAGLKVRADNLPALKEKLEKIVLQQVDPVDLQPKISVDATLSLDEAGFAFMNEMRMLEPFGNQNPQPVFYIEKVTLVKPPVVLKGKHVKCFIFSHGIVKPIIFFNRPDLYKVLSSIGDDSFDVCAYVTKNEWQERVSIELQGVDVAF